MDSRDLIELTHCAELLDASAQRTLAVKFACNGTGVPLNDDFALYWYHQAAQRGNVDAQYHLGTLCCVGNSKIRFGNSLADNNASPSQPPHLAEAAYWFREAALQGHIASHTNLAWMYRVGEGVDQDYAKAFFWYCMAAEKGYSLGQIGVGVMYDHGMGVEQNDAEAMRWYRMAADQGDPRGQNNVAWMLDLGQGVEQSDEQAHYWFYKSASAGLAIAQFSVGSFYELGQGVGREDDTARYWYREAAWKNETDAIIHCKLLEAEGRDSLETDADFVAWHRRQAEDGDPAAQFNLGLMYEKSLLGVTRDIQLAMQWYDKAANQTHENARQRKKFLSRGQ